MRVERLSVFAVTLVLLAAVAWFDCAHAQTVDSLIVVPRLSFKRLDASLGCDRVGYDLVEPWRAVLAASYKLGPSLAAVGSVRAWQSRAPEWAGGLRLSFIRGGRPVLPFGRAR